MMNGTIYFTSDLKKNIRRRVFHGMIPHQNRDLAINSSFILARGRKFKTQFMSQTEPFDQKSSENP